MIVSVSRRTLRPYRYRRFGTLVVSCLWAYGSLFGQTPAPTNSPTHPNMKSFVLIFRQGANSLSDADRKQISTKMPGWAAQQRDSGRKLDPRILADGPSQILKGGEISAPASDQRPLTALLFIEAEDFQEAVRVAESHPGLSFGVSIEVRAWTPPVPAPVAPQ